MKNIEEKLEHKYMKFVQKYSGGTWRLTIENKFSSLVK